MADQLSITNGKVVITTEEGQRLERSEGQLVEMLRGEFVAPVGDRALPDGVKFCEWRAPLLLLVHQQPPHVRQFRWIAADSPSDFGPGTKYRKVRLGVPYAVTFAVYFQRGDGLFLMHTNELYFRNEPLRSRTDTLGYPALLNISRIATPQRERAWICTQHLIWPPEADWTGQLHALLEHIWNGGFNLSSEAHEGASWYGASKGIHRDLHPIEKWEKATAANDAFALGVPWKPVPLNVGQLMDALFEENQQALTGAAPKPARRKKAPGLISRFLNHMLKG
ncbi:MAG TPA: hypothetical protein VEL76_26830 [Gemmataceae bacterium]|nr:hypothetical protein [Gemmataceae bacterium]